MLTLPSECPEEGCKVMLQRALEPGLGVRPHYGVMHPGRPVPAVAEQISK